MDAAHSIAAGAGWSELINDNVHLSTFIIRQKHAEPESTANTLATSKCATLDLESYFLYNFESDQTHISPNYLARPAELLKHRNQCSCAACWTTSKALMGQASCSTSYTVRNLNLIIQKKNVLKKNSHATWRFMFCTSHNENENQCAWSNVRPQAWNIVAVISLAGYLTASDQKKHFHILRSRW